MIPPRRSDVLGWVALWLLTVLAVVVGEVLWTFLMRPWLAWPEP